jgi:hypothetical protein
MLKNTKTRTLTSIVSQLQKAQLDKAREDAQLQAHFAQELLNKNLTAIKNATTVDRLLCAWAILDEVSRILVEWTIPNEGEPETKEVIVTV